MIELTTQSAAESLLAHPEPVWILKHSNTCPVSSEALAEVRSFLARQPMTAGLVIVQESRPLSNWLATRLGFVHQSPQLFLLAEGRVRWQASHWGITQAAMSKAVSST